MDSNTLKPFPFYTTNGNKITTDPFVYVLETRDPTVQDVNYPQQKMWINLTTEKLFVLTSFSTVTGVIQANWSELSSSTSDVNSLTGDDAIVINPVSNNINVVGATLGAFETQSGGAGILEGKVNVDGTTIFINGSNQLSVNNLGINWQLINTNQTIADSTGYVLQAPGGALVLTLPVISNAGDTCEIVLDGATSFTIAQNALQQISYLNFDTTVGLVGNVQSTVQGNYVKMVCVEANLRWRILTATGSIILT